MNGLYDKVEKLQNLLIGRATGQDVNNEEFVALRSDILNQAALKPYVPEFLRRYRNLDQFWGFIKSQDSSYAGRTKYLSDEFYPLFDFLENGGGVPSDQAITDSLRKLNAEEVDLVWSKALERRSHDPDGAITAARALLESVCKHILEEAGVAFDPDLPITKLYNKTAEQLNMAASQHTEDIFKKILGSCTTIVQGLGELRNREGDAHGKGKKGYKPASRHAELAVNLAGALAAFLCASWEERCKETDQV